MKNVSRSYSSDREADEAHADASAKQHLLTEGAAPPSAPLAFALPRRAWVRWMDGCDVCDYLMEGETAADVVERCHEVLDWKVPGEAAGVSDAEAPAVPDASTTPPGASDGGRQGGAAAAGNDGKGGKVGGGGGGEQGGSSSSVKNYAMGAGVALMTAALSIVALDELELYDFY